MNTGLKIAKPTTFSDKNLSLFGFLIICLISLQSCISENSGEIDSVFFGEGNLTNNQGSVTEGMVAYYPFANNANDMSGKSNHGIPNNGVDFNTHFATFGGFDGRGQIKVNNSQSLNFSDGFTISLFFVLYSKWGMDGWGNFSEESSQCLFAKNGDRNGLYASLNFNNNNECLIAFRHKSGIDFTATIPDFPLHVWYHVCFTASTSALKIYVNGSLKGNYPLQGISFAEANQRDLYFGFWGWYPLDGAMDEIKIFNRALTRSEIIQLYGDGRP